jgi:hypothetical protein
VAVDEHQPGRRDDRAQTGDHAQQGRAVTPDDDREPAGGERAPDLLPQAIGHGDQTRLVEQAGVGSAAGIGRR